MLVSLQGCDVNRAVCAIREHGFIAWRRVRQACANLADPRRRAHFVMQITAVLEKIRFALVILIRSTIKFILRSSKNRLTAKLVMAK